MSNKVQCSIAAAVSVRLGQRHRVDWRLGCDASRSSCTLVGEAVGISDLTKSFVIWVIISEGLAQGAPIGLSRISTRHEFCKNYSNLEIIVDNELLAIGD